MNTGVILGSCSATECSLIRRAIKMLLNEILVRNKQCGWKWGVQVAGATLNSLQQAEGFFSTLPWTFAKDQRLLNETELERQGVRQAKSHGHLPCLKKICIPPKQWICKRRKNPAMLEIPLPRKNPVMLEIPLPPGSERKGNGGSSTPSCQLGLCRWGWIDFSDILLFTKGG